MPSADKLKAALQGLGAPEVTTNNDNNPASLDKAWTFRRVSFGRDGLRLLKAIVTDGANTYEANTRIGVQDFKLEGQKNIVLFIGDAMGTAYRDAGRIVAQTPIIVSEGFSTSYSKWIRCL
jgi:alkaline phosphatase